MKLTGTTDRATLTVNGKRCGVLVCARPWIEGVDPRTMKLRPRRSCIPAEIRVGIAVEDNSDSRSDYFEAGAIRLLSGHPLYYAAKGIAAQRRPTPP